MSKVCGVGVNDFNGKVSADGVHIKEYRLWKSMLARCYEGKNLPCYNAYANTKVAEELLSFTAFYNFVRTCKGFGNKGWNMDKDILGDGSVYAPETIAFVPQEVNMFFVVNLKCIYKLPLGVKYDKRSKRYCAALKKEGKTKNLGYFNTPEAAHKVYCIEKEKYAKLLAEKWCEHLDNRIYEKLLNFKVID